ncbi:hypothetical protein Air01nite_45750 [Asanoa iriomotensis]|uniref:Uncharacterized protein n=1 Tax=Asanoa iriomotensis TaxID=234613 RepID=A0ABQ4C820_9ACTN|nr:hypothetical protein Air01nite_45750 [Asanoa iriomotensis]
MPAPAPADLAPPKRRRGLLVGLGVLLVLVLVAVPAFLVLNSGSGQEPATAAGQSPSASGSPSPTGPAPSPKPGDPPHVQLAWTKARITESLGAMNKAFRAGDLAAFVKPAFDKKMRAELERRFRSLRAMRARDFALTIDSGPFDSKMVGGYAEWGVSVAINHCYVQSPCEPQNLLVDTAWRDSPKGFRLTKFSLVKDVYGPQPWEYSTLTAAIGSRAVVAAPTALASRARSFLPAAERAAKIADRYVLGGPKPDRYVIYLAGPSEWKKWFGGTEDWAIGYAIPVSDQRSDIVLKAAEISGGYAESVMKHEMGHVATLAGRDYHDANGENWWLTEGIAEYIEWDGRSVSSYDRKQSSRRMLREKKFTGNLEKLVPADDAPDWQIDAAYGLGYYATRCIADQYGHAKLMRFADVVLRGGRPSEVESQPILGAAWSTVTKRCLAYTKQKVGA